MALAGGLGCDLERDVRESGHVLTVNLVECDVPALHLLAHGGGVLAGLNEGGYTLCRCIRCNLLDMNRIIRKKISAGRLCLLDSYGANWEGNVPICARIEAIAGNKVFVFIKGNARKRSAAILIRFQNPSPRGLLGQVLLRVEAVVVLDGELRALERAGAEGGGLARLAIDLGHQHVGRVVLGRVGDVHGGGLAARHVHLVDPLIKCIGLAGLGLLDVVGARGDIDNVRVAGGAAGERSHLLGATGVGVDAVGRALERIARVIVGDAGVGARLLELQLALVVEGDEALGAGAVVDEVDRILE